MRNENRNKPARGYKNIFEMMSGATRHVNKGWEGRVRRGSMGKRGEADWPFNVISYNVIFIQHRGLLSFILPSRVVLQNSFKNIVNNMVIKIIIISISM